LQILISKIYGRSVVITLNIFWNFIMLNIVLA